ncbi:hypothetical protein M758_5G098000 [Ceratodon purpureus]|nr:hypothetical protein M758_5G098000 [Ceratodon purpureus]
MSLRSTRRLSGLCSLDDAPQLPPRKRPGYWLTPPSPAVYCASASSIQEAPSAQAFSPPLEEPAAVFDHSFRQKRRCILQLEADMEEEKVTKDLCTSFRNVESIESRKSDVVSWRSATSTTNSTSNGMDLPQSETTCEGNMVLAVEDKSGVDPVRSAAELLTQLTCRRNGDTDGQPPDVTSCTPYSRHTERRGLELPIRWGVRKKVSYESRRSVDACDLVLYTGPTRRFSYDQDKTSARKPGYPPDKRTETGLKSGRLGSLDSTTKKLDGHTSPYYPASSKYHGVLRPSEEAGTSSGLQLAQVSTQGPRDLKQNKTSPSSSRTSPGNILRYKTAQLKLVDIMLERKAVPGKPILRPALREEARKHIGDTGLLDHLLKHMTDTVVNTGQRFRRRHNSEGAMEYWLEHASLMDLRKAAGVEDPSWIPPLGWKPGDKLPDRNWQMNRHDLTSSEAAWMKHLKETVDRLKSDMKLLCGSIKVSNQRGVLTGMSVSHQIIPFGDTPTRGEEELNSTQDPERTPRKEIPLVSDNQVDLEGQLQVVCQTLASMQDEVTDIIKMLGIVPPIKATPVRYPPNPNTPGYPMPFLLLTGDSSSMSCTVTSPGSQPPEPMLDAPMRQCSTFSNVMDQGSNGDDVMGNLVPYADGLSQALSNYKLVKKPDLFSACSPVEEKYKPKEKTLSIGHQGAPLVEVDMKQERVPNFKPIFACQPTGFRLCRPAGSFVWPSAVNCTSTIPTNNPPMTRSQDQTVELRGLEDGSGNTSLRQTLGLPNFALASVSQENSSTRSTGESQVATAMASKFECMAMAAPLPLVPTLPLMTKKVALSAKDTGGTTTNYSGHYSSPEGPIDSVLSLSLSLSGPTGSHHYNSLKKSV